MGLLRRNAATVPRVHLFPDPSKALMLRPLKQRLAELLLPPVISSNPVSLLLYILLFYETFFNLPSPSLIFHTPPRSVLLTFSLRLPTDERTVTLISPTSINPLDFSTTSVSPQQLCYLFVFCPAVCESFFDTALPVTSPGFFMRSTGTVRSFSKALELWFVSELLFFPFCILLY